MYLLFSVNIVGSSLGTGFICSTLNIRGQCYISASTLLHTSFLGAVKCGYLLVVFSLIPHQNLTSYKMSVALSVSFPINDTFKLIIALIFKDFKGCFVFAFSLNLFFILQSLGFLQNLFTVKC